MKATILLLAAAVAVNALPSQQIAFQDQAKHTLLDTLTDGLDMVEAVVSQVEAQAMSYAKSKIQHLKADEDGFEVITMAELPDHQIRLKEPKGLCDPGVKQYSGYLDVGTDKHLFFWFFESRNSPATDPVTLWLNGGPGCSSSTGLLFELGPCAVANEGKNLTYNPYSWTSKSSVLFLDQPINVGLSWSDSESVNNTPAAAVDVYAFLQLWYKKFPLYGKLPFHIAAESYGGHYAPHFASYIHKENKALAVRSTEHVHIPLTSVLIGNGLTEPVTQFASVYDFACKGDKKIFDDATCTSIKAKTPTCARLQEYCYSNPSRLTCVPATLYCWQNIVGPISNSGLNPYDVRRKCDRNGKDGPLCYQQMQWIEAFMNRPEVKKELGAPDKLKFESCNMQVNQAFSFQGDGMKNSAVLLPELIDDGIRVLIYAGEDDFMCNYLGNKRWALALDQTVQHDFVAAKDLPWSTLEDNKVVGEVRSVGEGAGNFAYVKVYNAGHMVPYDQPSAALDLFNRWIADIPLAKNADK